MCSEQDPQTHFKLVANGNIWFLTKRDWSQECCPGNNIVGIIQFLMQCTCQVASLKNTAPIFLKILDSLFYSGTIYDITFSFAQYKNMNFSNMKKRYSKRENTILQISSSSFLLHSHFNLVLASIYKLVRYNNKIILLQFIL